MQAYLCPAQKGKRTKRNMTTAALSRAARKELIPMGECYIHQSVSVKAVNEFFERTLEKRNEIHTLQVYKDGKTLIRVGCEPYRCSDVRENNSVSKSFTSTAIGLCYDEGLVRPEDRIVDIFADYIDFPVSENLAAMTVENLLTMGSGHADCVLKPVRESDDPIRTFLQQEVPYSPGEHFVYNTGASWMLGAIVEKVTGIPLFDYISAKLFLPLGICDAKWPTVKTGTAEGGAGLNISNDDMMKFGLLYLNRGVHNGRRILSEEWIDRATAPYAGEKSKEHDWVCGYGYQFWMNEEGGYRADGAYGQFIYIWPEQNAVISVQTECHDNYAVLKGIRNLVRGIYNKEEDKEGDFPRIPSYPPFGGGAETLFCDGKIYYAGKNDADIRTFAFELTGEKELLFRFTNGFEQQTIRCGNGCHIHNEWNGYKWQPRLDLLGRFQPTYRMTAAASYRLTEGRVEIQLRMTNCPHTLHLLFSEDGEEGKLELRPVVHPSLIPEARQELRAKCIGQI